jgi:hypothetical protein
VENDGRQSGGKAVTARLRAVTRHEPSYPTFVHGRRGDVLRLTPRPDTFPGWLWCTASDGVASWVPQEFLAVSGDVAVLRRDYDATELYVEAADALEELERVGGWVRCRKATGEEGWVPRECVGD